jgi:hypothetical protein
MIDKDPSTSVRDRMNVQRAAEYLGLSQSTLNKMRGEGRGPRYVRLESRVFYRRSDLDEYVSRGVRETADSRSAAA